MSFDTISSGKIRADSGNSFSAIKIDGDGVLIRNAADETNSSGELVLAGSEEVLSSNRVSGTTINASYIKTGVLDANLLRAGLIQTVPSWNTKWYGAPEDHAAVQMGFTGGSIAATAVSTGSGTVSLTLPGGHGLITGDYVRVSGLFFTTGTLLGGVGLNLPTNGPLDYASATVATNTLTYSKSDITSGLTASTASTVYVGKAHTITSVVRTYDDPANPAELSTVVVTTSAAHGLSAGNYVEIVNVAPTIDGVAYISAVTSTTFTFKQRFGDDVTLDLSASEFDLPSLLAPVAIKVLKSYTQNADGSIHITSGTVDSTLIVGEISATEITIGSGEGVVRVGNYPDAISPTFQGIWAGSATPSTAEFSVSTAGALTATSGSIGGWTLGSTTLTGTNVTLNNTGVVTAGTGNNVAVMSAADATYRMWVGNAAAASAPFRVTSGGAITSTNLTVTGGSIDFGDFRLSTDGQITKDLVLSQKFIKNENGVNLISTESDGGEAYALSKAVSDGIYTGVQNGSFGAEPPTPASNINNSTNPLPYWTLTSSSANITARLSDDTPTAFAAAGVGIAVATATGKKLTFNVASGATTGSNAYVERYVAIPASVARSYTFQPRVAWRDATAGATDVIGFIETQYFKGDATTKTGTQGNKTVVITGAVANTPTAGTVRYTYTADENNTIVAGDLIYVYESTSSSAGAYNLSGVVSAATATAPFTFDIAGNPSGTYTSGGVARQYPGFNSLSFIANQISTGYVGYESWANPNNTGNVPGDGAYLRIRVGVRVVATTSATRSLDVAEVRLDRGPIQLLLTDQTSPGVYGYGGMWLSGGQLYIRPNETGPGYDVATGLPHAGSTGIKNPEIDLVASSGQIFLNPSSTGSVVVQSKAAASGGSAAAIPLKVFGIASQTGDLQQWLDVSSNVLASIGSTGNLYLRDSIVFEGASANAFETTLQATDPTADRTLTLPDATGTVALTSQIPSITGTTFDLTGDVSMSAAALNIGSANSYSVTVTNDGHSHTGTTLSAIGSASISASAIGTTQLAASAVTAAKIAANTITGAEIASGAIGASELSSSISITTSGTMTPTGTADITGTSGYNSVYMGGSSGVSKRFYRFTGVSEERLKENITPTSLAADAIYGLNPIDFNFRASASELYPNIEFPTTRQWGLTVENAREVFPSAVSGGQNGDPYGIHWERIYFGMLVAIKDLNARVVELEAKIAELETGA